ncbi:hypothetical protein HELRODRAFT_178925 [Helobdella robusta]|uniref:RING-type domain-containing protein n=1 Tax=Helobdella robusta TaxID=6412 RepID=T1FDW7_HELRO|nr:hypothetical protein HELRODRAFT_178925 [Helobdella robusta]ESN95745.1 hypothetical protein HELRODRAFT_178925 [Helobdella robusta]
MDFVRELKIKFGVQKIVEKYLKSHEKNHRKIQAHACRMYLHENLELLEFSEEDAERFASILASDSDRLLELNSIQTYKSLASVDRYMLLRYMQEFQNDYMIMYYGNDIIWSYDFSHNGLRFSGDVHHSNVFPIEYKTEGVYKFPYFREHFSNANDTCPICCDEFEENSFVLKLSCGHIFHPDCLENWFVEKQNCPFCRKKVTLYQVFSYDCKSMSLEDGSMNVEIQMRSVPNTME